MPYNFVADGFHNLKNFVADFLQVKCDFTRKTTVLLFLSPLWGLGAMYDVHLIGSLEVDFPLVIIELFR